jgi:simple sugar transport system permease protein
MLNYVVTNFCCAMFYGPFKDPAAFYGTTRRMPEAHWLPDTPLGFHWGVVAALLLAAAAHFIMARTAFGAELRATGFNRKAAVAAGIPAGRVFNAGVLAGAAMGGLAGGIEVAGVVHQVAQSWAMNWGFIGVCVAFLGGSALGVVPIAFLLSVISTGARFMQAMTGVPESLASVMQGFPVIIFLVFTAVKLNSSSVDIKMVWRRLGFAGGGERGVGRG